MEKLLCGSDHKAIWFNDVVIGKHGPNKSSTKILTRFLNIQDRELHKIEAINKTKPKQCNKGKQCSEKEYIYKHGSKKR